MADVYFGAHDEDHATHYTPSAFPKSGGQTQFPVPVPVLQKKLPTHKFLHRTLTEARYRFLGGPGVTPLPSMDTAGACVAKNGPMDLSGECFTKSAAISVVAHAVGEQSGQRRRSRYRLGIVGSHRTNADWPCFVPSTITAAANRALWRMP